MAAKATIVGGVGYEPPEEVKEGDMEALEKLDIRKIAELKEAFSILDLNNDGYIDATDLKASYISMGSIVSEDQIVRMLGEAEEPLDFDAFIMLMALKSIELDPEEVLLEAFSQWDSKGTGLVNQLQIHHDLVSYGNPFSDEEAEEALAEAPIAKGTGDGFNCAGEPMIDYPAFCKVFCGFRRK